MSANPERSDIDPAFSPESLGLEGLYLSAYQQAIDIIRNAPGGSGNDLLNGLKADCEKVLFHVLEMLRAMDDEPSQARVIEREHILRVASTVIERGRLQFSESGMPRLTARRLPTTPNRLATEVTQCDLEQFHELRRLILKDYSTNLEHAPRAKQGRLISLQILFQGALGQRTLAAALRKQKAIEITGPWVHLDLELQDAQGLFAGLRRHFMHPTLALLMVSDQIAVGDSEDPQAELIRQDGKPSGKAQRALRAYLSTLALPFGVKENIGIQGLMALTSRALRAYLPEVVVRYLEGDLPSESLPASVLRRTHGCESADGTSDDEQEPEGSPDPPPQDPPPASSAWQKALQQIWGALRCTSDLEASRLLRQCAADLEALADAPPAAVLITKCFDHLLSKGLCSGRKPKLSTLRLMNGQITERWLAAVALRHPKELSVEELSDCYLGVIESIESPGARSRVCGHLRELDHFLRADNHIPSWPRAYIPGSGGWGSVNANLIAPSELKDICSVLRSAASGFVTQGEREAAALLTELCWATGPRSNEGVHLRCGDVLPGQNPLLCIAEHLLRGLKSKASQRRFNLLIAGQDVAERMTRLAGCSGGRRTRNWQEQLIAPLFGQGDVVWDHRVIPRIKKVMKEVTGDAGLHFHHTRHSAATLIFLALALLAFDGIRERDDAFRKEFDRLMSTSEILRYANDMRNDLSRLLLGRAGVSALSGEAVARLLGHASSATSYEHYIHCLDMVAYLHLQTIPAPNLYSAGFASTNKSRTFGRDWLHDHGLSSLIRIAETHPERVKVAQPKGCTNTDSLDPSSHEFGLVEDCERELRRLAETGEKVEVGSWFGLANKRLRELARYRHSGKGGGQPRHELPEIEGQPLPPPLIEADQLRIAKRLTEVLYRARQVEPSEVSWLLDYWAHNAYRIRSRIVFRENSLDLQRFQRVLEAGGLKPDELKMFIQDGNELRPAHRNRRSVSRGDRRLLVQVAPCGILARHSAVTWAFAMQWVLDHAGNQTTPSESVPRGSPADTSVPIAYPEKPGGVASSKLSAA